MQKEVSHITQDVNEEDPLQTVYRTVQTPFQAVCPGIHQQGFASCLLM